jgi:hypothetical protein
MLEDMEARQNQLKSSRKYLTSKQHGEGVKCDLPLGEPEATSKQIGIVGMPFYFYGQII